MEPDKKEQAMRTLLLDKEIEEVIEDKPTSQQDFTNSLIESNPTVLKIDRLLEEKRKVDLSSEKIQTKDQVKQSLFPKKQIHEIKEEKLEIRENQEQQSQFSLESVDFQSHECIVDSGQMDDEDASVKPQKSKKFRFKLIAISYALVLALCVGWTIGNAIAINNQASALEITTTNYELSLKKYVMKLSQLDGIEITDEIDEFSPITSAIELQPLPLAEPSEYSMSSNWFDKLCNWLSKLFGR